MTHIHACKIMPLTYTMIGNVYVQEGQVVLVLQGNLGIQQSPKMQKKTQLRCEQFHALLHGATEVHNHLIIARKTGLRTVNK